MFAVFLTMLTQPWAMAEDPFLWKRPPPQLSCNLLPFTIKPSPQARLHPNPARKLEFVGMLKFVFQKPCARPLKIKDVPKTRWEKSAEKFDVLMKNKTTKKVEIVRKQSLYVANSQAGWQQRFLLWRMTLPSLCDDERSSRLARAPFGPAGNFAGHPRNQSCPCRKPNLEAAAPGNTAVPTSGP